MQIVSDKIITQRYAPLALNPRHAPDAEQITNDNDLILMFIQDTVNNVIPMI